MMSRREHRTRTALHPPHDPAPWFGTSTALPSARRRSWPSPASSSSAGSSLHMARQPEALPRRRASERRTRSGCARWARRPCPNTAALWVVARRCCSSRVCAAHPGGHAADADEPRGAAGRLPRPRLRRRHVRGADDALGRRDHPALHHLPPAAPDVRHACIPNFIEDDLPQRRDRISGVVGGAFYIVANLALGLHLYHGLWSMFNSLGLNTRVQSAGGASSPPRSR